MSVGRKERAEEENKDGLSDKEEMRSVEEEDFEEAMREAAPSTTSRRKPGPCKKQIVPKIPEAVEDFLRNFLQRSGLSRTMNSFEAEWYSSAQKLMTETLAMAATGVLFIPDALTHRQLLQSELETAHRETDLLRQDVLLAGEGLVRMQRERGFYRLQYRRVAEDKNRLMEDFKQLKKHLESYKLALRQLEDKYQAALGQKMLISLKKDRVQNTTDIRMNQEKSQIKKERSMKRSSSADNSTATSTISTQSKDTEFAACSRRVHPFLPQKWKSPSSFSLSYSIRAHKLPISCIDLHPRKLILASASDDRSWKLWVLQANGEKVGQMVMTGEGHSDWLSGCSFHPDGAKLATSSGDSMVRLWDFSRSCCVLTLPGHSQPTWGCSFHSCGHFLASCSADRTAKLWDLNSQRCHLTLRRHTASVNSVCFLPFSNLLITCSADKTLAMWDARMGVCTATFHGHQHPCNHTTFSPAGNVMASCDSCGIINLWDIRKPALAVAMVDAGPLAANRVAFNPSGKTLAVASTDCLVRVVEVDSCVTSSLLGHSDSVQSVTFNHGGETVISAGSEGVINVWA
ncbi:LOW QUALITY PROTEIN: sperm-associated antigen 16 protein [Cottoperca gobio]|uniref:LOW QUALITY PROTEIN: sperm-associated antigen 16 protein n=1 Tax=Cottoperca gobio TaxID=56716 RepID=A0A6J2QSM8_COTGO|nr:LOW QUALITY PROTEIN: sperm-associated antigen 16 protein [Cottoperca gobio]